MDVFKNGKDLIRYFTQFPIYIPRVKVCIAGNKVVEFKLVSTNSTINLKENNHTLTTNIPTITSIYRYNYLVPKGVLLRKYIKLKEVTSNEKV